MGLFDKLLANVEDADRQVFTKYPKLAEEVDKADEFVSRWETWKANNWDADNNMTKNAVETLRQKDAEIEALRALQGGDVDWDDLKGNVLSEIEATLKNRGVQSAADIRKSITDELNPKLSVKMGDRDIPVAQYIQNTERGMELLYAKSAHLPVRYIREFGNDAPEMTMEDLLKHVQTNNLRDANGLWDFEKGYQSFVAPLKAKKAEEEAKTREDKIRQETKDEVLKEVAMRQGAMPLDSRGSAPEQSPSALQMRISASKKQEVDGAPKLTPGELGSMAGTQDAYQAYLRDQATGKKQSFPFGTIQ